MSLVIFFILPANDASAVSQKNLTKCSHSDHVCIAIGVQGSATVCSRVSGHFFVAEFLQSFDPAVVEHLIFGDHVIQGGVVITGVEFHFFVADCVGTLRSKLHSLVSCEERQVFFIHY